ncbi:hypothetical protein DE146DRAFT_463010 [Phaeosphaeria sp. MPI-PUGE-AT-0046c]|nr:hypothetical protein DE146DRAFT_463010 [Phaeosphaeria sp. MPI-PUGE-AT-0046c]
MQGVSLPAEPLLAGSMMGDGEMGHVFASFGLGDEDKETSSGAGDVVRVGTGMKSVDDALGGGVYAGNVLGVWVDGGEVCRMILVDSLLKYPDGMAAVVDSTGDFDVLGVYTGLLERLRRGTEDFEKMKMKEEDTVEEVAARALDRIKIMRVFDFVGVREAIGEIRDGLERGEVHDHKTKELRREPHQIVSKPATPKRPTPEPLTPEPQPRRTAVADSEDEDEDEEMLFDTIAPSQAVQKAEPSPKPDIQHPSTHTNPEPESSEEATQPRTPIKCILIDNLAQVLNPLLKKDYIQANALSTPFLHSLAHLTRTHGLHTILSNPATALRAHSPTRQSSPNMPGQLIPPPPPQQNKPLPPPPPSVFASNALVPALSSVVARYVDVGVLVSQVPKTKMDAKVYYREGNEGVKRLRGVEMVGVVEVVSDRWEGRVGAWGVL